MRWERHFALSGALLVSVLAGVACCCDRRPAPCPPTVCLPAPVGPWSQSPPAAATTTDPENRCPPVESACFHNLSPNPVNLIYEWCAAPGAGCWLDGQYRIPPGGTCDPTPDPRRAGRHVRLHVWDAGYRQTRWFECPPDCLARTYVKYEGYFLRGSIYLQSTSARSCWFWLGPPVSDQAPSMMPEVGCPPCRMPPPAGGPSEPPPPHGDPNPPPVPPMPAVATTGLQSIKFVQYWQPMNDRIDASFTGTDGAGAGAFDRVEFANAQHAVQNEVKSFTLGGKAADPKPVVIKVDWSVKGAAQTGSTITAKSGRFLKTVTVTLDDKLTIDAVQDDGAKADVTTP
jgi:hypothetical protein